MNFMPQIVRALIRVIRVAKENDNDWESFCTDLANIVELAGDLVKGCMKEMAEMFRDLWTSNTPFLNLVKTAAKAAGDDFGTYFPLIVPALRTMVTEDRTSDHSTSLKWLRLLPSFGASMEGWLNVIIPLIATLFDETVPVNVWREALDTLTNLSEKMNIRESAPTLVHLVARTLDCQPSLQEQCMTLLVRVMVQMGADYYKFGFNTTIGDILLRLRVQDNEYERFLRALLNGDSLPRFLPASASPPKNLEETQMQFVNQDSLKKAWEQIPTSAEDWTDWLKRFSRVLMKESTSLALRACSRLAEVHPTLGRELFNAAFVSCWAELYGENQEELAAQLDRAMTDTTENTREIKQVNVTIGLCISLSYQGSSRAC